MHFISKYYFFMWILEYYVFSLNIETSVWDNVKNNSELLV